MKRCNTSTHVYNKLQMVPVQKGGREENTNKKFVELLVQSLNMSSNTIGEHPPPLVEEAGPH